MKHRVFIPLDSASIGLGADEVANQLAQLAARQGVELDIVRTGSYGLTWLEPLVEVETPQGRLAYGPVTASDVGGLLASKFYLGGSHPLSLGDIANHAFLKSQTRLVFSRCGRIDPLSLADYKTAGGLCGLENAIAMGPESILTAVTVSGLRGRGGAGFPAGMKWRTVHDAVSDIKYIVCNADEGDSGTFSDRMIMEGDPYSVIEGMVIAGIATRATHGYIYIRSEYPIAASVMERAILHARQQGLLGSAVSGSTYKFDMEVRLGAGAYVCGEETSLLESLEGRRGQVRAKPPLPAHQGLFGKPTAVNNVITLASVPAILAAGAEKYKALGTGRSLGTIPIQLAGNVKYAGLYEAPFGLTLRQIVMDIGGGTASGRSVRAVQVGGPLGAYFPVDLLDTPFDYEAFTAKGGLIGHAGVVVFDDTVDMAQQARFAMEFCAIESCGKCTPCRIGSVRGRETIDRIIKGEDVDAHLVLLEELCTTMKLGSLCALGGFVPFPVMSALTHFPEDFRRQSRPLAQIA